jgi:pSer/pThr/pTyr-binding forkhead associated (FHA) protein
MKLSLVVLTAGKWQGKEISIPVPHFMIGRDPICQLRPSTPLVSKRHCAIISRDDQIFVTDCNSTNGTFVNERQIRGEFELKGGDRLRVGPLEFLVRMEDSVPVDRNTPLPLSKPLIPSPDEEAAALLLSMQETDAESPHPTIAVDKDGIPVGSTLHEPMPSTDTGETDAEKTGAAATENGKADKNQLEKVKQAAADTSAAASAILTKYLRRDRKPAS